MTKQNKWMMLILILGMLPLLSGCMPHTVGSSEVGVRVRKVPLGSGRGVDAQPYGPGTYFFMPILNDWYTLDTRVQQLEMAVPSDTNVEFKDDLVFKTIDGNDISLDVIISYRIDPDKAPYILQYVGLTNDEIKYTVVRTITRSKPRDIFGELTTEQFYDPVERNAKANLVVEALNKILNPYGVIVEQVLTKNYRFNTAYERAIKDKKIADQQTQKYVSESRAAQEENKKNLEDAAGEVNKMVAKVDGDFMQAKIQADAYYEQQERVAAAIEAEGRAEATAITKMNEALASEGGRVLVKLRMAQALKDKKIIVMPFTEGGLDIKSTNVNELLQTYGVKQLAATKAGVRVSGSSPVNE